MRRMLTVAIIAVMVAACTSDGSTGQRGPPAEAAPNRAGASESSCPDLPRMAARVRRGYVEFLSPDVMLIPHEPNYIGSAAAPVHSGPWDYLAEVPLVFFGPGIVPQAGEVSRPATMADVAPTIARLIGYGFDAPDGRVLPEVVDQPADPPRVMVTVVWDGGGGNTLRAHRGSWPYLESLMRRGISYGRATIGSSPSVTPPIHTTLGTGAWPRTSGIPGLRMRTPNGEYVDPFIGLSPSNIRVPTLADTYDVARDNLPVAGMLASANWHLGMIGHGRAHQGGDSDPAVLLLSTGDLVTNTSLYSLPDVGDPAALERFRTALDSADGENDGYWSDHPLDDDEVRFSSPANVAYEEYLLERLIDAEGFGADSVPDLLYVNFKASDDAGHRWGIASREVGEVLAAQDDALRRLVSYLDRSAGRRQWVLIVTADHGQTPYPQDSGGWPIGGAELKADANAALDRVDNGVDLVDRVVSPGAYVDAQELKRNHLHLSVVGRWMAGYTVRENVKRGESVPEWFEGSVQDPLFDGAMVHGRVFRSCSP